ncbi:hypothetical protein J5J83_07820 [Azoarcus sp. L1K30]|uniref:hypothetical protein n=1 Tax=Azoarcus sp. L1K30 TaxID=2820277 RepID=UPI001B838B14|nr:hypothetical protein [Azoarcus sp. L1K30]MBR0566019.1 hypothetical protein [Azoarcus sp. L1K30]
MTRVRFILDDATQCNTQRAVLSAFAADLEKRAQGEIVRSSQLTEWRTWDDVPAESSRRLALRLLALESAPDLVTVFLPGHIVPGEIALLASGTEALAAYGFTTVADLDLFVVDNAHAQVRQFQDFVSSGADYEAISRYEGFSAGSLPMQIGADGLTSALLFTQRPWYSAFSPARIRWLGWVKQAMAMGVLDAGMVDDDIRAGLVRPSLQCDVNALLEGGVAPQMPDLTLDSLFVVPEQRLTAEQYLLLHSDELQRRTVRYSKLKKGSGKVAKSRTLKSRLKGFRRPLRFLRRLPSLGFRAAYVLYSMTARPAVKRLRERSRAKP